MLILEKVGTTNLRGIRFSESVPLKRITVLVGKNSAGKSTFARTFPLVRQSVETLRKSPILWFGHLVDFGTFEDVCNRDQPNGPVQLQFVLRSAITKGQPPSAAKSKFSDPRRLRIPEGYEVCVTISISKGDEGSYLSHTKLVIGEQTIEISVDTSGHLTEIRCGEHKWSPTLAEVGYSLEGRLLPEFIFIRTSSKNEVEVVEPPFLELVKKEFLPLLHGNTHERTLLSIARQLPIGSIDQFGDALQLAVKKRELTNYISKGNSKSQIRRLADAICLYRYEDLLGEVLTELTEYFGGVRYLAPLRATAQRYYRTQELSVDEIDPQGANVANILSSIPYWQKASLNKWTEKHLQFKVDAVTRGGHASLHITPRGSDQSTNLADMGFGFSQVLPIAIQLWISANEKQLGRGLKNKTKPTTCFVIEQPELHLHPSMQASLADLFVAAGDTEGTNAPHMVIETHSSALINRFGELVHAGKIDKGDIQILLFEGVSTEKSGNVRSVKFDSDGYLEDWPIGFFEPDNQVGE